MTTGNEPYRIVVGAGGAGVAQHALAWALKEAATRGGEVIVVRAVDPLPRRAPYAGASDRGGACARDEATRALDSVLSSAGSGDVPVFYQVVADLPARALVAASTRADLLAVGARTHADGEVELGATARACLRYASCPVVVVPTPQVRVPAELLPSAVN